MNLVDLGVLVVLLLSALLGFSNGFVREVLGVLAWIGGAVVSFIGGPYVMPWVRTMVSNPNLVMPAAYGAVFLPALVLFWIASRLLSGMVRGSLLSGLDRLLGICFGIARGALLFIIAYIVGGSLIPSDRWPDMVRNARSVPYIYAGARWLVKIEPSGWVRPQLQPPPGESESA